MLSAKLLATALPTIACIRLSRGMDRDQSKFSEGCLTLAKHSTHKVTRISLHEQERSFSTVYMEFNTDT